MMLIIERAKFGIQENIKHYTDEYESDGYNR